MNAECIAMCSLIDCMFWSTVIVLVFTQRLFNNWLKTARRLVDNWLKTGRRLLEYYLKRPLSKSKSDYKSPKEKRFPDWRIVGEPVTPKKGKNIIHGKVAARGSTRPSGWASWGVVCTSVTSSLRIGRRKSTSAHDLILLFYWPIVSQVLSVAWISKIRR